MGDIAQLFPYRESGKLMFRGIVGAGDAGDISQFFPVRIGSQMYLRGLNADGDVIYGFPYRDASGRLMSRTMNAPPIVAGRCCDGNGIDPRVFSVSGVYGAGNTPYTRSGMHLTVRPGWGDCYFESTGQQHIRYGYEFSSPSPGSWIIYVLLGGAWHCGYATPAASCEDLPEDLTYVDGSYCVRPTTFNVTRTA